MGSQVAAQLRGRHAHTTSPWCQTKPPPPAPAGPKPLRFRRLSSLCCRPGETLADTKGGTELHGIHPHTHISRRSDTTRLFCAPSANSTTSARARGSVLKKPRFGFYSLAASECIFMEHTVNIQYCGKSRDRPIGGPCPPKPRPRTSVGREVARSPPIVSVYWPLELPRHEKAGNGEISPSHARI